MNTKKIKIIASSDWSTRYTLFEFAQFAYPVLQYQGKKYHVEFDKVGAEPVLCGENLEKIADLILLRHDESNEYYKAWIEQAQNSGILLSNHPHTMTTYDKHSAYDLFSRCLHPQDYFPKTVLLPPFSPYNDDQKRQAVWEYEQMLIARHTKYGFDNFRRHTNFNQIHSDLKRYHLECERQKVMRSLFYAQNNYLEDVVEKVFHGQFPLYLKYALGHGEVYKIEFMGELFQKFDTTRGHVCYLQESIQDYDAQIACFSVGPLVLPVAYNHDVLPQEKYSQTLIQLPADLYTRLKNYANFLANYYVWNENVLEVLIKKDCIIPMDVSNPLPDTNFLSLHVHFPWTICAQFIWYSYMALHGNFPSAHQEEQLRFLQNPEKKRLEKYEYHAQRSSEHFDLPAFQEFCDTNFRDILDKMIAFYNIKGEEIIRYAIHYSDFPKDQHEKYYQHYKEMMDKIFKPNIQKYLAYLF